MYLAKDVDTSQGEPLNRNSAGENEVTEGKIGLSEPAGDMGV